MESFSHKRLASIHSFEDDGQSDLDDDEESLEQRREDEREDDRVILSQCDDIFEQSDSDEVNNFCCMHDYLKLQDSCCNDDVDKYPQSDSSESDISGTMYN